LAEITTAAAATTTTTLLSVEGINGKQNYVVSKKQKSQTRSDEQKNIIRVHTQACTMYNTQTYTHILSDTGVYNTQRDI